MKNWLQICSLSGLVLLVGCTAPQYERPNANVSENWTANYAQGQEGAVLKKWCEFYREPALRELLALALTNNHDLRAAALNVESFQALYRVQRAALGPNVEAGLSGTRQKAGGAPAATNYTASLGVGWEIDLFGRLRNLNQAAVEQYLAQTELKQAVQSSLLAGVAIAYFSWQTDMELLRLSENTLRTYQESYQLMEHSRNVGVASELELIQLRTQVESAKINVARYKRLVEQDANALVVLVGTKLPENAVAAIELNKELLQPLPAGLPSQILQKRPDILAAEHQLKAANANIGAARAAFFPSVSLTAAGGSISGDLDKLFSSGTDFWQFTPKISVPIFASGRLKANLDYAKLQKQSQIAQYEKAIMQAFREVADGLIARDTYNEQLNAQRDLVATSTRYYNLAEKRYQTGIDSNLNFLDAQRLLFNSQQSLLNDRLGKIISEINLYKALGGGGEVAESNNQTNS